MYFIQIALYISCVLVVYVCFRAILDFTAQRESVYTEIVRYFTMMALCAIAIFLVYNVMFK